MNRSDERKELGAGMARSRSEAHSDEESETHGKVADDNEISGGRGIKHESVEAENVMGDGGKIGVKSAEGEADMASSKANRKEADEPERESNEKAAMGRDRSVPTKNTMGWGERETKSCHTI